jgi:hypothetical protein
VGTQNVTRRGSDLCKGESAKGEDYDGEHQLLHENYLPDEGEGFKTPQP